MSWLMVLFCARLPPRDWTKRTFLSLWRDSLEPAHSRVKARGVSTASTLASSSSLARSSLAPTPSLARFVEELSVLEPSRGSNHYDRLPDGRTTLVVRSLEDGSGDVCVMGPHSRARFKELSGVARAVVLHFKPGWAPQLLGVPAVTLTDRIVPLADVWGRTGTTLSDELLATAKVDDVLGLLSRTLDAQGLREEPASARLVRRAVRLLEVVKCAWSAWPSGSGSRHATSAVHSPRASELGPRSLLARYD
jgi:hypothetical protein